MNYSHGLMQCLWCGCICSYRANKSACNNLHASKLVYARAHSFLSPWQIFEQQQKDNKRFIRQEFDNELVENHSKINEKSELNSGETRLIFAQKELIEFNKIYAKK